MKINATSPWNIKCGADLSWTPILGGWSGCTPYFTPQLGASGYTPISLVVYHG